MSALSKVWRSESQRAGGGESVADFSEVKPDDVTLETEHKPLGTKQAHVNNFKAGDFLEKVPTNNTHLLSTWEHRGSEGRENTLETFCWIRLEPHCLKAGHLDLQRVTGAASLSSFRSAPEIPASCWSGYWTTLWLFKSILCKNSVSKCLKTPQPLFYMLSSCVLTSHIFSKMFKSQKSFLFGHRWCF